MMIRFGFQFINAICLIMLILFFASCQREQSDPIPDVSHIQVQPDFYNFDELVHRAIENGVPGLQSLIDKHPAFSEVYFGGIMEMWDDDYPLDSLYLRMRDFMESPFYTSMSDTISLVFSDFETIENELQSAFQFYRYYFPDRTLPLVYYFISEFTYSSVIFEHETGTDGLGIGLDMFLHGYFDYSLLSYFNTAFSAYNIRTLNKDHLTRKTMDVIWDDILGPPPMGRTIDIMLYHAKMHHLNKLTQPYAHDSIIFEYTPSQLRWAEDNEAQIYNYLIENKLLYTTDLGKYARLVNPAPHSAGMPPEAPGRVVNWLAYKMLRAWVRNNPNKTLNDLIELKDGHEFLMQSRYRPGRY